MRNLQGVIVLSITLVVCVLANASSSLRPSSLALGKAHHKRKNSKGNIRETEETSIVATAASAGVM